MSSFQTDSLHRYTREIGLLASQKDNFISFDLCGEFVAKNVGNGASSAIEVSERKTAEANKVLLQLLAILITVILDIAPVKVFKELAFRL
jgi:hypothetical protein